MDIELEDDQLEELLEFPYNENEEEFFCDEGICSEDDVAFEFMAEELLPPHLA